MKYCPNCGNQVAENQPVCPNCGTHLVVQQDPNVAPIDPSLQKSKMAAGLLAIFVGGLGVHNFYLGYTAKGVIQLCLTVFGWIVCVGPIVAEIWGIVEGIMILTGSINKDSNGVPFKD